MVRLVLAVRKLMRSSGCEHLKNGLYNDLIATPTQRAKEQQSHFSYVQVGEFYPSPSLEVFFLSCTFNRSSESRGSPLTWMRWNGWSARARKKSPPRSVRLSSFLFSSSSSTSLYSLLSYNIQIPKGSPSNERICGAQPNRDRWREGKNEKEKKKNLLWYILLTFEKKRHRYTLHCVQLARGNTKEKRRKRDADLFAF